MKKVLIVDDEPAICKVLEKFLSRKAYRVSSALSGEETLAKIEKDRPDLVLLDIRMPGLDGLEVLKKIREADKDIRIIMITASKDDETAQQCLGLGACGYITKPFDLARLEHVLLKKLA